MAARAASQILCVIVAGVSIWGAGSALYSLDSSLSTPDSRTSTLYIQSTFTLHSLYLLHTGPAISANMPSSHASSEAGSFSSAPPAASHSYKKSLSSKADPNTALSEDPNLSEIGAASSTSLRSMQHTDREGRLITDPDLSNPTRPRLERPLDTIRSFEAAIERNHRDNIM